VVAATVGVPLEHPLPCAQSCQPTSDSRPLMAALGSGSLAELELAVPALRPRRCRLQTEVQSQLELVAVQRLELLAAQRAGDHLALQRQSQQHYLPLQAALTQLLVARAAAMPREQAGPQPSPDVR
jgi:hypothetical protein